MSNIVIVLTGFGGAAACLGVAYWVYQRGRAPALPPPETDRSAIAETSVKAEPGTEFMSREEILSAANRRRAAPGDAAKAEPSTEFMSREEVLAAADKRRAAPGDAARAEPGTEFMSREEILAAAQRRATPSSAAVEPSTELLSRNDVPRTEVLSRHLALGNSTKSETEQLSREEVLAFGLRETRTADAPATTLLARDEVRASAPKFEPTHVPEPPSTATATLASSPDISDETLAQHFGEGLRALESVLEALASPHPRMVELAQGPERIWRGNVEILSLASARVLQQMLLPELRATNTAPQRRLALALTILELKSTNTTNIVLDSYGDLTDDADGRRALLDALSHWDDPRADRTIIKAIERFPTDARWLAVAAERGCELPVELVQALLSDKNPARLAAGFRLLPRCPGAEKLHAIVDRHLVAGPPEQREPAIVTGLIIGRPSATLVSKQAARDPAMPEVCEAHASTASPVDAKALIAWAAKPGAPAHAGWVLGLIGTVEALDACVAHLAEGDEAIVEAALAGFAAATGFNGDTKAVKSWWAAQRGSYLVGKRYLCGEIVDGEGLRRALLWAPERLRRAIGRELALRSGGRIWLPARRLPSGWLAVDQRA